MTASDSEQNAGVSESKDAVSPKPTLFQRWKTHMKKWWWVYVIVVCCIVLVTVLPIVYVGVPHFANQYINKYDYNYDGLRITKPSPTSFHLSQSQRLKMGGGFSGSGHLSAFEASIKLPDSNDEIALFPVPRIEFGNGVDFTISQDLNLSCVSCMSKVAAAAASDKDFSLLVTGKPDLEFGALPTAHLDIKKPMRMKGYNIQEYLNTDGAFNVTGIDLLRSPTPEGYNVNATVAFRNPTPFIVEMGLVSLNLSLGDTSIGYVDIPNLYLQRHVTETTVMGNIDESKLINEGVWNSGSDFGAVEVGIHGNRCVYDGQEIPYFTAAIQAVQATVKINLMDFASQIL